MYPDQNANDAGEEDKPSEDVLALFWGPMEVEGQPNQNSTFSSAAELQGALFVMYQDRLDKGIVDPPAASDPLTFSESTIDGCSLSTMELVDNMKNFAYLSQIKSTDRAKQGDMLLMV